MKSTYTRFASVALLAILAPSAFFTRSEAFHIPVIKTSMLPEKKLGNNLVIFTYAPPLTAASLSNETIVLGRDAYQATTSSETIVLDREAYHETTAPRTTSTKRQRPNLKTWKLRLNTHQDVHSAHKISVFIFLLSGLYIVANGVACHFDQVQDYLMIPTYLFTVSAHISSISSSIMAWKYRSREPEIRNGMINLAVIVSLLSFVPLWVAHFGPPVFDVEWVSKGIFQGFCSVAFVGAAEGVVRGDEMVANRKNRLRQKNMAATTNPYWLDWAQYVAPNIITLFYVSLIFWAFGIHLSREDHMKLIESGVLHESLGFYSTVASALLSSCLVFIQTLRDKKLISKDMEGWAISISSVLLVVAQEGFVSTPDIISIV